MVYIFKEKTENKVTNFSIQYDMNKENILLPASEFYKILVEKSYLIDHDHVVYNVEKEYLK